MQVKRSSKKKKLAIAVAAIAVIALLAGGLSTALAKPIGSKNQQACDACNGIAPTFQDHRGGSPSSNETSASSGDYSADTTGIGGEWSDQTDLPYKKAINGTPDSNNKYEEINGVWTGGNAHSAKADRGTWTDSDINDFQSVLPFGTIYVDPTKLYDTTISHPNFPDRTWENWYGKDLPAYPFTEDTTITLSEYASDKFMLFATRSSPTLQIDNGNGKFTKLDPVRDLYYQAQNEYYQEKIGYIGEFTPASVNNGIKTVEDGGKALITVRYPNVATLSDGSSADLVIKYTKVTIQIKDETDKIGKYKDYEYTDADGVRKTIPINGPLGIIDANQLYVDRAFIYEQGNKTWRAFENNPSGTGVEIEYEVSVEKDGNTVDGTILWTANDLDIEDQYSGIDYNTAYYNTDGSKVPYAESMEILEGAKSYAVTPYYDHSGSGKDYENPLGFQIDNAYYNSADYTANGVRFFAAARHDGSTYDSGFSALISSGGDTKMRWTGSKKNWTLMGTVLFDTTVINQIRMSHGTGGGIYLENYDGDNDCKVDRIEGIAAHGLYAEATLTAVPEDGYRVKAIYVDDTGTAAKGYDSSKAGKTKYEIKYKEDNGEYKVDGIVDPNDGNKVVKIGTDGKYTMSNDIVFEVNDDGTVDVTMKRISNFKHVHVDFEADYFFYKTWVGEKPPTTLELTATPYVYEYSFKFDHDDDGTGNTFTLKGGIISGAGDSWTLENNNWKVTKTDGTLLQYIVAGDEIRAADGSVLKTMDKKMV